MTDKTIQEAVRDAIRFLGLRAHGGAELAAKLKKKGFEAETVDAAISRLESLGLIDDKGFAAGFMESLAKRKPEGRFRARARLLQKGLSEELVDDVLRDYDAAAMCMAAAEKKMRSLSGTPEARRKKLETFLRNRGFDWSSISETLSMLGEPPMSDDQS
jgi:regulatory protein